MYPQDLGMVWIPPGMEAKMEAFKKQYGVNPYLTFAAMRGAAPTPATPPVAYKPTPILAEQVRAAALPPPSAPLSHVSRVARTLAVEPGRVPPPSLAPPPFEVEPWAPPPEAPAFAMMPAVAREIIKKRRPVGRYPTISPLHARPAWNLRDAISRIFGGTRAVPVWQRTETELPTQTRPAWQREEFPERAVPAWSFQKGLRAVFGLGFGPGPDVYSYPTPLGSGFG